MEAKISKLAQEHRSLLMRNSSARASVKYFAEKSEDEQDTPLWLAALEVVFSVLPISMVLFSIGLILAAVLAEDLAIPVRIFLFFMGSFIPLLFLWGFVRWLRKEIAKTKQRFGVFLLGDEIVVRTEVSTAIVVPRSALISISQVPLSNGSWRADLSTMAGPLHINSWQFDGLRWEHLQAWSPERTLGPPAGWESAIARTRT